MSVAGSNGIPASGVAAVAINVTATGSTGAGHVTVFAGGATRPTVSNLNFVAGQTVANQVFATVGAGGRINLYTSAKVQLIVDITGYFPTGGFHAITPTRVYDSRITQGRPQPGGYTHDVQVASAADIPLNGVGAYVLTVTAASPATAGHLTVEPDGRAVANTSDVNFVAGRSTAGTVLAAASWDGGLEVAAVGQTAVIVDVVGWIPINSRYGAAPATRLLDTRYGIGGARRPVTPDQPVTVDLAKLSGVNANDLRAADVTVTAVGRASAGYATAAAVGAARPSNSTVNFIAGQASSNSATVAVAHGKFSVYVSTAVDVIVDVSGFWRTSGHVPTVSYGAPKLIDEDQQGQVSGVSCPTAAFCVAGDVFGNVLQWNGTRWSRPTQVAPTSHSQGISSVSCPSASFCAAVTVFGGVVTFDGHVWSAHHVIDTSAGLVSVSCPSAQFCIAIDGAGRALAYRAGSWGSPQLIDPSPGPWGMAQVSCSTESFCVALDSAGRSVRYTGTWSAPQATGFGASAIARIACPSASFCVAMTGNDARSFNGTKWSAPVGIDDANSGYVSDLSCPSASSCTAVDDHGDAARFDGKTWTPPQQMGPAPGFWGAKNLACVSTQFCVVTTDEAYAVYSAGRWGSSVAFDNGDGRLGPLACTSGLFCATADGGSEAFMLSAGPTGWSEPIVSSPTVGSPSGLACADATFCLATGWGIVQWNGTTWTASWKGETHVNAVSCSSRTWCVAVGADGLLLKWDGRSWTTISLGTSDWTGVSCPQAGWCMAVDEHGGTSHLAGGSWSAPAAADSLGGVNSVSCASASFCAAGDREGAVLIWNGTHWSQPSVVASTGIGSMSCPTTTFCSGLDGAGDQFTYDSGSWSVPAPVTSAVPDEVSCPRADWCAAVGTDGQIVAGRRTSS